MSDLLLELAAKYFTRHEWTPTPLADHPRVLELKLEDASWRSYAKVTENDHAFLFYSVCPVNVPADRRAAVAEFITRVNFGLISGNFELDLADGELRFKTGIELRRLTPSVDLIDALVRPNFAAMSRYLPGAVMVMQGEADPASARAQCEED